MKTDEALASRANAVGAGPVRIRVDRVMDRLDMLLAKKDYAAAEAHLLYWLGESRSAGDDAAELAMINELMGFYRKQGVREKAFEYARTGVGDFGSPGRLGDSIIYATTCLNAATVYKAFGEPEKALALYRACHDIYTRRLSPDDLRFAGLYNNMGLALLETGDSDGAENAFYDALRLQEPYGLSTAPDRAITYLNLCDLYYFLANENGDDENTIPGDVFQNKIEECAEKAYELLSSPGVSHDAYFAFVCEKCFPVFGFYGFFKYKNDLEKWADEINSSYGS